MHGRKAEEALHEPTHPRPLPGGEEAFVRVVPVPLLGGVRGGFMVPMHGIKVVGAFHEPPVWSSGFSRSRPPEGGTPYRLHDPDGSWFKCMRKNERGSP